MSDSSTAIAQRPPLWRDVRVLRVVAQLLFLVVVVAAAMVLWNNLIRNMRNTGLPTGFAYLERPAGFTILGSAFRPAQTNLTAVMVGVKNTVLVSAVGIVLATVIGVLVGIARLSTNWLVRKAAAFYVETLRNVPVLLIIFFASLAVIGQALPQLDSAWRIEGWFVISNRVIAVPWLEGQGASVYHMALVIVALGVPAAFVALRSVRRILLGMTAGLRFVLSAAMVAVIAAAIVGLVVSAWADESWRVSATSAFWALVVLAGWGGFLVARWRTAISDRTGRPHHRVVWAFLTFVLLVWAAFLVTGAPLKLSGPSLEGRRIIGGISMVQSYAALLVALTLYTASHIAEIVRGSILAVPRGQAEAATALALTAFQRMRYVILPQAFRIMVPPLANQYLSLTKNSSLGVAIGFQELTTVTGTIIGNGNPATQSIAILMIVYLSFSLFISVITNIINRRLQVATRR